MNRPPPQPHRFYARHGDDATRTAAAFFCEYVARRKPVLIKGRLRDPEWAADKKWTDAYLSKVAGAARVMVEAREDARARFGRYDELAGVCTWMCFPWNGD